MKITVVSRNPHEEDVEHLYVKSVTDTQSSNGIRVRFQTGRKDSVYVGVAEVKLEMDPPWYQGVGVFLLRHPQHVKRKVIASRFHEHEKWVVSGSNQAPQMLHDDNARLSQYEMIRELDWEV